MKYKLKIYDIWELGRREKQEDSIFPEYGKAQDSDRLFVLCDGMGGHDAGEVASGTVCAAMAASVSEHCPEPEGAFSDEDFAEALDDAFNALDKKDTGAAKKMGTTLTFLKFHDKGCTSAHMGDSRVYHIRPGKSADDTGILFQTVDHSLVNDLVKVGELTPEEARHSNQKNVITRAMQPNMSKRPKADLYHTSDIKPGDYFMLCSDGMLEQMEDDNLRYIFSDKGGDAPHKVEMLKKVTAQNRDNHSAIIVHVTDVTDVADAADTADIPADRDVPDRDVVRFREALCLFGTVSCRLGTVSGRSGTVSGFFGAILRCFGTVRENLCLSVVPPPALGDHFRDNSFARICRLQYVQTQVG